jgi:4-hydroxybenzoate polyprenyltransferase
VLGLLRVVHPFPSLLDGLVVLVVALVAGGEPAVAVRLGLSMTLIQFAIGALNDLVDAPRDAGRKAGKPIPAGLVTAATAHGLIVGCAALGLALAALSGAAVFALGLAGFGIGVVYDLRAKGTVMSWAPLALGIPLLPVYGWFGAVGTLPSVFLALVPIAALEGGALAIANSLVDVERDREAGSESVATHLGPASASIALVVGQLLVGLLAIGTASAEGAPPGWLSAVVLAAGVPVVGAVASLASIHRPPAWREVAWEIQAVGAGVLAVAWLGSLGAAGGLGMAGGL